MLVAIKKEWDQMKFDYLVFLVFLVLLVLLVWPPGSRSC